MYVTFLKTVLAALFRTISLNFFFFFCLQNIHFSVTISPPKNSDFSIFLSVIFTDKPVNRSKYAYAVTQLNVLASRVFFSVMIFSNKKRKEFEKIGLHNTKKYVSGKCTRAGRAPLARKHTNRILESQGGTEQV